MMNLHVTNETSRLRAVVLGRADSNGPMPKLEDAYDPHSAEHIKAGTYPSDEDMVKEMDAVAAVFANTASPDKNGKAMSTAPTMRRIILSAEPTLLIMIFLN